jgi:HSP20 family protein
MTTQTPVKDLLPRLQQSATSAVAPLQRELDRFFEQLGDGWKALGELRLTPQMDVLESKEALQFKVELPGLTAADVRISVDEDTLTVTGERKEENLREEESFRIVERASGAFSRSVYLPNSVDRSRITAEMKDGLLTIVAPKREDAESRSIEIKAG